MRIPGGMRNLAAGLSSGLRPLQRGHQRPKGRARIAGVPAPRHAARPPEPVGGAASHSGPGGRSPDLVAVAHHHLVGPRQDVVNHHLAARVVGVAAQPVRRVDVLNDVDAARPQRVGEEVHKALPLLCAQGSKKGAAGTRAALGAGGSRVCAAAGSTTSAQRNECSAPFPPSPASTRSPTCAFWWPPSSMMTSKSPPVSLIHLRPQDRGVQARCMHQVDGTP